MRSGQRDDGFAAAASGPRRTCSDQRDSVGQDGHTLDTDSRGYRHNTIMTLSWRRSSCWSRPIYKRYI